MVIFSPVACFCLCALMSACRAQHLAPPPPPPARSQSEWRWQTGQPAYNSSYQSPYGLHALEYAREERDYLQSYRLLDYDARTNELDYVPGYGGEDPLLVGYSHNPYGESVKSTEFSTDPTSRDPTSVQGTSGAETRGKRGVVHLYNMISCATGCDPVSYKGYGCYCGFLGSGRALDDIDRCCKIHDHCYEDLFCPIFTVYFQPYYWRCHHGQPLCALENSNTRNQFINGCAAKLCECDRQLAMCLQRYQCPRRRAICRSSPLRLLQNLLMAR